jgi:hypothetical protein
LISNQERYVEDCQTCGVAVSVLELLTASWHTYSIPLNYPPDKKNGSEIP